MVDNQHYHSPHLPCRHKHIPTVSSHHLIHQDHLDQYYWNPNWEETEENKWYEIIESSAAKDK